MGTLKAILAAGIFSLLSISAFAQCDNEDFLDNCSAQLSDFKFVKSFEADKKTEFSYVFSKDHNYLLTVCDGGNGGKSNMKVNLYDRNHKLIMSSYSKSTKKYYPKLSYKCTATGVYYIETDFSSGSTCGVSILGYKK